MRAELAVVLGCVLALASCSGKELPEPPARLRLADDPLGVLRAVPAPAAAEVFFEDFEEGFDGGFSSDPDGWRLATNAERPLDFEFGVVRVAKASWGAAGEPNRETAATLAGRRGALFRVVEVEPNRPYRFSAKVKAEGLEPASLPFFGATPWIAELEGDIHGWQDLEGGLEGRIHVRHQFPTAYGREGWQERRSVFVTGPHTTALLVSCLLAFQTELEAGEVSFTDIRLERLSAEGLWRELRTAETHALAASEPDLAGWRGKRRVRAWLGGEWRPSVVLFPGEVLGFRVRIPSRGASLETGLGPWRTAYTEAVRAGRKLGLRMRIEVDGDEVFDREIDLSGKTVDARWKDQAIDLSDYAGEEVTLSLRVDGTLPGVFGAPMIRDSASLAAMARGGQRKNLILVSIDTLRADHVGCYGGSASTPHLDALAARGIRFEEVQSAAPFTLPSHASMFSGQLPTVHGVTTGGRVLTPRRSPVLARILAAAGYRTEAFTAGGFLNADFGFDQGFDGFATVDPIRDPGSVHLRLLAERDPDRFDRKLFGEYGPARIDAFLETHAQEPFFLFLHTFTVHDYDPPPAWRTCDEKGCTSTRTDYKAYHLGVAHPWTPQPVSDVDRAHLGHIYDEALASVDDSLGHVFERLEELGILESTVIAVTSDHGEELFERGFVQHGKTLYREVVRVPWILFAPGRAPRVVSTPATGADLAPTLLGALGLPLDARMQGLDLLHGEVAPRPRWCEVNDGYVHRDSLTDDASGFVLIHSPEDTAAFFPQEDSWELYDLSADPAERENLVDSAPDEFRRLEEALLSEREALERLGEELGGLGLGQVEEGTRLELEELGYGGR